MSTTAKIGIILVIILALLVLIWSWYGHSSTPGAEPTSADLVQNTPIATPTPTPISVTVGTGLSASTDITSDSIQSDMQAFDQQMTALDGDNATTDESIKASAN